MLNIKFKSFLFPYSQNKETSKKISPDPDAFNFNFFQTFKEKIPMSDNVFHKIRRKEAILIWFMSSA